MSYQDKMRSSIVKWAVILKRVKILPNEGIGVLCPNGIDVLDFSVLLPQNSATADLRTYV